MKTSGRTFIITADATGKAIVPQGMHRHYLIIGPTTAEAWSLSLFNTTAGSLGVAYSATVPQATVCRDDIGDAIDGQHVIYGTANHTFAVTEVCTAL